MGRASKRCLPHPGTLAKRGVAGTLAEFTESAGAYRTATSAKEGRQGLNHASLSSPLGSGLVPPPIAAPLAGWLVSSRVTPQSPLSPVVLWLWGIGWGAPLLPRSLQEAPPAHTTQSMPRAAAVSGREGGGWTSPKKRPQRAPLARGSHFVSVAPPLARTPQETARSRLEAVCRLFARAVVLSRLCVRGWQTEVRLW
eukprot:15467111-Alexandrium_andersonii.AAC.2